MKKRITTDLAPKAIGPYSQAIVAKGDMIYVSGQLPVDPATGKLVEGDIKILTRRIIQNLEAILKAANSSLEQVVRTDVFLKDFKCDFQGMNEEYAHWFKGETPPARQTVQVSELPLGALIEISCIARSND